MLPTNGGSALFELVIDCHVYCSFLPAHTYINYTQRSLVIRRTSGNILILLTFDMTVRVHCPMNETSFKVKVKLKVLMLLLTVLQEVKGKMFL